MEKFNDHIINQLYNEVKLIDTNNIPDNIKYIINLNDIKNNIYIKPNFIKYNFSIDKLDSISENFFKYYNDIFENDMKDKINEKINKFSTYEKVFFWNDLENFINREKQLSKEYYCIYYTIDSFEKFYQDIITMMMNLMNNIPVTENYKKLQLDVNEKRTYLCNLSVFSNFHSEDSIIYKYNKNDSSSNSLILKQFLSKSFDINDDDYDKIIDFYNEAFENYKLKIINQIFIKKNIFDSVAYLSDSNKLKILTDDYNGSEIMKKLSNNNINDVNDILLECIKDDIKKKQSIKYVIGREKYLSELLYVSLKYNDSFFKDNNVLFFYNNNLEHISDIEYNNTITNICFYLLFKSIKNNSIKKDSIFYKNYIENKTVLYGGKVSENFKKFVTNIKNYFGYNDYQQKKQFSFLSNIGNSESLLSFLYKNKFDIINVKANDYSQNPTLLMKEINKMMIREKNYSDKYFALYSAFTAEIKFYYDVMTIVKSLLDMNNLNFNFRITRVNIPQKIDSIEDFFEYVMKIENKSPFKWSDHDKSWIEYGTCVNLSLFGNYDNDGESTMNFWMSNSNISPTVEFVKRSSDYLKSILGIDNFNVIKKIYDENLSNRNIGFLNQILIKKNIIDKLVYISSALGYPLNHYNKYDSDFDIGTTEYILNLYQNGKIDKLNQLIEQKEKTTKTSAPNLFGSVPLKKFYYLQGRLIYNEKYFTEDNILWFESDVGRYKSEKYYNKITTFILKELIKSISSSNINIDKNITSSNLYKNYHKIISDKTLVKEDLLTINNIDKTKISEILTSFVSNVVLQNDDLRLNLYKELTSLFYNIKKKYFINELSDFIDDVYFLFKGGNVFEGINKAVLKILKSETKEEINFFNLGTDSKKSDIDFSIVIDFETCKNKYNEDEDKWNKLKIKLTLLCELIAYDMLRDVQTYYNLSTGTYKYKELSNFIGSDEEYEDLITKLQSLTDIEIVGVLNNINSDFNNLSFNVNYINNENTMSLHQFNDFLKGKKNINNIDHKKPEFNNTITYYESLNFKPLILDDSLPDSHVGYEIEDIANTLTYDGIKKTVENINLSDKQDYVKKNIFKTTVNKEMVIDMSKDSAYMSEISSHSNKYSDAFSIFTLVRLVIKYRIFFKLKNGLVINGEKVKYTYIDTFGEFIDITVLKENDNLRKHIFSDKLKNIQIRKINDLEIYTYSNKSLLFELYTILLNYTQDQPWENKKYSKRLDRFFKLCYIVLKYDKKFNYTNSIGDKVNALITHLSLLSLSNDNDILEMSILIHDIEKNIYSLSDDDYKKMFDMFLKPILQYKYMVNKTINDNSNILPLKSKLIDHLTKCDYYCFIIFDSLQYQHLIKESETLISIGGYYEKYLKYKKKYIEEKKKLNKSSFNKN